MNEAAIETLCTWLGDAEAVLIAAGAGMSAAAGLDYGDRRRFAELFPALLPLGLRARYELIGRTDLPEALFWPFWARHVADICFGPRDDPPYRDLQALTRQHDRFVLTSNVDSLFERNGFDAGHIHTPQGDYRLMQCARACTPQVWPSEPQLRRVLAATDAQTQRLVDRSALPRCPVCSGPVFLNVRIDGYFIEQPHAESGQRLARWLADQQARRLLILEIGAGFNTPSVIRWPCEGLAARRPNTKLARLNLTHSALQSPLGERGLSITGDAGEVLARLVGLR
ncbi:hypothetical protein [Pseudaquabacterium rugosum]|uniref:Deacetylase sirtuin-type domain-containing protein n=1 Tax=Pseudaquabacterium rugosum TaxID=2984194 RepID=A0ABU9BD07_9BURK